MTQETVTPTQAEVIAFCNEAFRNAGIGFVEHDHIADIADALGSFAARHAADAVKRETAPLNRMLTDNAYMIGALVNMLGPKGRQVWQGWQEKGVQRVHYDWQTAAGPMTGEERAEVILQWDRAARTPLTNIDNIAIRTPHTKD